MKKKKYGSEVKTESELGVYKMLRLADPATVDKKTNTTSPSDDAVEDTREWSEELKL